MATRAADDFDTIRARIEAIRAEERKAQAEAAAQRAKEAQALVPAPAPVAPALVAPHVVVGMEDPYAVGLRPIGEILGRLPDGREVNPALEDVFAMVRAYLFAPCVEDGPNAPNFRGIPIRFVGESE